MPAQFRPRGTIAFASALLAFGLGFGVPADVAVAVDCLASPISPAPPNGHWYYRTDRTQERKCWHLQTGNGPSEKEAAQTAREAPAKPSQSVVAGGPDAGSGFKEFVAQHRAVKLSNEDVEKLYADFLEWKRRTKN